MAHTASGSRPGLMLVAGLLVGLVVGFAIGYYLPSRVPATPEVARPPQEFTAEAKNVPLDAPGTYEVVYAETFARAPELTILTDEMRRGVAYTLVEQRTDGFRIKIGSNTTRIDNPLGSAYLRYKVRGEVAGKTLLK